LNAFRSLGDVTETLHGPMIYQDNGADILAVAHLDYVDYTRPRFQKHKVFCPQLDDRLGAWVILDLLPSLGLKYDVLLTDSEERGQSTAQYFKANKEYRWVFEFDRAGTDVVMYEFETPQLCDVLQDSGFEVGFGSFTDICELSDLGCAAFNFGVGYYNQHTRQCYANLRHTARNVSKFLEFFNRYEDTRFEHDPIVPSMYRTGTKTFSDYGVTKFSDEPICEWCGDDLVFFRSQGYCRFCDRNQLQADLFPYERSSFHDFV
jgi:hypothetical protein